MKVSAEGVWRSWKFSGIAVSSTCWNRMSGLLRFGSMAWSALAGDTRVLSNVERDIERLKEVSPTERSWDDDGSVARMGAASIEDDERSR